jgi:hypothetical protein
MRYKENDSIIIKDEHYDEFFKDFEINDLWKIDWFNRKIKVRENGLESIRKPLKHYFHYNCSDEDKEAIIKYMEELNSHLTEPPFYTTCSQTDGDAMPSYWYDKWYDKSTDHKLPFGVYIKKEYLPHCYCQSNKSSWNYCKECGGISYGLQNDNYVKDKYSRFVLRVLVDLINKIEPEKEFEIKDEACYTLHQQNLIRKVSHEILDKYIKYYEEKDVFVGGFTKEFVDRGRK